jgi:hypothetical protein
MIDYTNIKKYINMFNLRDKSKDIKKTFNVNFYFLKQKRHGNTGHRMLARWQNYNSSNIIDFPSQS